MVKIKEQREVKKKKKATKKGLKLEGVKKVNKKNSQGVSKEESTWNPDLKVLRYSLSEEFTCERQLFLKRNGASKESLLVGNVPSYLPLEIVEKMIGQFVTTPIHEVVPQRSSALDGSLHAGQLVVSVVFESEKGVNDAMEECESVGPFLASDYGDVGVPGLLHDLCERYSQNLKTDEELQEACDKYMEKYDKRVQMEKLAAKRKRMEPDDDGWTVVTKGKRNNPGQFKKLKSNEEILSKTAKKKKRGHDIAFYNFQIKESKMKHLKDLREKFEEDKKRVALLKASRKFKPDL